MTPDALVPLESSPQEIADLLERVTRFETLVREWLTASHPEILQDISSTGAE